MEQGTTTGALNFFKARLTSGCERRVESESAVSNTDEHPIPSFNLLDVAETITSDGKFRIAGHGNWFKARSVNGVGNNANPVVCDECTLFNPEVLPATRPELATRRAFPAGYDDDRIWSIDDNPEHDDGDDNTDPPLPDWLKCRKASKCAQVASRMAGPLYEPGKPYDVRHEPATFFKRRLNGEYRGELPNDALIGEYRGELCAFASKWGDLIPPGLDTIRLITALLYATTDGPHKQLEALDRLASQIAAGLTTLCDDDDNTPPDLVLSTQ